MFAGSSTAAPSPLRPGCALGATHARRPPRKPPQQQPNNKKQTSEGGITGLWKGLGPNIGRNAIINAAELATYDQIKSSLLASGYFSDNIVTHITAGLGAGFFAVCIGSPVDVVKSRVMGARVVCVVVRVVCGGGLFALCFCRACFFGEGLFVCVCAVCGGGMGKGVAAWRRGGSRCSGGRWRQHTRHTRVVYFPTASARRELISFAERNDRAGFSPRRLKVDEQFTLTVMRARLCCSRGAYQNNSPERAG